jgi:hypothetical protein
LGGDEIESLLKCAVTGIRGFLLLRAIVVGA